MKISDLLNRVPAYEKLPSWTALNAATEALRRAAPAHVSITTIGRSTSGFPIEMISIGRGSRNALLVGAPHPNEPIGCLTIEFLIDQCLKHPEAFGDLDTAWHFIKCIEPEGLLLNQQWLDTPHDLGAYLRGYFRPALPEQAEYSFPLVTSNGRYGRPTRENIAWQQALRLTRPDLLVSLHNAEYGGAFYVLSGSLPGLPETLSKHPPKHGLAPDLIGEPFSEMVPLAPGVFEAFQPRAIVETMGDRFQWAGGDSSFGYTKSQGTLGLTIEVPYWKGAEVPDMDSIPLGLVYAPIRALCDEIIALQDAHADAICSAAASHEAAIARAIRETRQQNTRLQALLQHLPPASMPAGLALQQQRALSIMLLRGVGMLGRLATQIGTRGGHAAAAAMQSAHAADGLLSAALQGDLLSQGRLDVPLQDAVRVQTEAILTTLLAMRDAHANHPGTETGRTN